MSTRPSTQPIVHVDFFQNPAILVQHVSDEPPAFIPAPGDIITYEQTGRLMLQAMQHTTSCLKVPSAQLSATIIALRDLPSRHQYHVVAVCPGHNLDGSLPETSVPTDSTRFG